MLAPDPAQRASPVYVPLVVLLASLWAALPFLVLGAAASADRMSARTLKGAVLGGVLSAALAWWPWNELAFGGILLEAKGYFFIVALYVAIASPILVGVGMAVGGVVAVSGTRPANPPL
jgi:hypothetical protein